MIDVAVSNRQTRLAVDGDRLGEAVRAVMAGSTISRAEISVVVVDDPTIHDLNRRFLDHDWPTDVISFPLEQEDGYVEGEVVASADTALAEAPTYGWSGEDELLLYVIHGTLHLVGYDDATPEEKAEMQRRQREILAIFNLQSRDEEAAADPPSPVSDRGGKNPP